MDKNVNFKGWTLSEVQKRKDIRGLRGHCSLGRKKREFRYKGFETMQRTKRTALVSSGP